MANKDDTTQLLQRLKAFADVALIPHRNGTPHMHALVSKLQDALGSVERFPVQCSNLGSNVSTSLRAFGGSSGMPSKPFCCCISIDVQDADCYSPGVPAA